MYPTQTAQFTASVSGTMPITNSWQFNGTSLSDGTQGDGSVISGSGTTTLTVSNVTTNEAGNYTLTTTNAFGGTNSTPAVLTVLAFNAATNFTMTAFEAAGSDWNSTGVWNDGLGGQPATSGTPLEFPGSSFEVLNGLRFAAPQTVELLRQDFFAFPGVKLTVDGNGIFTNVAGTAASTVGLVKLKGSSSGGRQPCDQLFPIAGNRGWRESGQRGLPALPWFERGTNQYCQGHHQHHIKHANLC